MAIILLPPPRGSGSLEGDMAGAIQWMHDLHRAITKENTLLTAAEQAVSSDFDPSTLPDPASTTLAQAQETANNAYILADAADTRAEDLEDRLPDSARVTVSGTDFTFEFVFDEAQPDTEYFGHFTASDFTGTPSSNAFIVVKQTRATDKVTVELLGAPGAGTSVTFDCSIKRNAE